MRNINKIFLTVTITESTVGVPKRKCEEAPLGILPNLFYIPRTNSGFYATDSGTSADFATVKESVLLDKCYSNFSLRDVGMADYVTESEIEETENIQPEEEEGSTPINVSRVSIIDDKFDVSEKLIPSSTFEVSRKPNRFTHTFLLYFMFRRRIT